MTNKSLRLTLSANLIFAERAANEPTRSMINKGEQQSAFIVGGSSGDFYQMQGISVTPLMPVALGAVPTVRPRGAPSKALSVARSMPRSASLGQGPSFPEHLPLRELRAGRHRI
jgi:hypothetical protein